MYEIIQDFLLFLLLKIMTEKKCGTMDPKIYSNLTIVRGRSPGFWASKDVKTPIKVIMMAVGTKIWIFFHPKITSIAKWELKLAEGHFQNIKFYEKFVRITKTSF